MRTDPPPRGLILACDGIADIDATAADVFGEVVGQLEASGVELRLARVRGPVRDALRETGILQELDRGAIPHG